MKDFEKKGKRGSLLLPFFHLDFGAADNPLRTLDNVIITPHIGMNSREAANAISVLCAENVAALLTGGEVPNRVV